MGHGEEADAIRAPAERVAGPMHAAARAQLLEQLSEIRTIAGLLGVRALAIDDDDARDQMAYLARQLQRHAGACLALIEQLPV